MRKLLVAAFCLVGICAWWALTPTDNPVRVAWELRGGDGCWELPAYGCPYTTYTCASTPCSSGWTGWYCPSGADQQTALPAYVYCTSSETGSEECLVPNQNIWQVCATKQSCGSSCTMAVAGPAAGTYFCSGPVGPNWNVTIFPMPALFGPDCQPPEWSIT